MKSSRNPDSKSGSAHMSQSRQRSGRGSQGRGRGSQGRGRGRGRGQDNPRSSRPRQVRIERPPRQRRPMESNNEKPIVPLNTLLGMFENTIRTSDMNALKHVEFEIRFGSAKYQIHKRQYENVFKKLIESSYVKQGNDNYMLRLMFENVSDIRCEIESLNDIQKYCRSNMIDEVEHKFISKTIPTNLEDLYYNSDMNFRVSIKNEEQVNENDNRLTRIMGEVDSSVSKFRYIKRTSLVNDKYPNVRIDMSMVQKHNKGSTIFQEFVSKKVKEYYYEVEIELINIKKDSFDLNNIAKQLKETIKIILSGIQETNFPVSYRQQEDAVYGYLGLIENDNIDIHDKETKLTSYFIGPSSLTLQMKNVIEDEESTSVNIQKNFCVTDKADGERKLMYIHNDNKIYLINTNLSVQYTGTYFNSDSSYKGTLIDGEHILYDKNGNYINLYAAFDIYFYKGKDYRTLPFIKYINEEASSSNRQLTRYKILNSVLNTEKSIRSYFKYSTSNEYYHMKTIVKDFKVGYYKQAGRTIFDGCKFILEKEELGQFPYNIDGLIFTSTILGVGLTPEEMFGKQKSQNEDADSKKDNDSDDEEEPGPKVINHRHTWHHSFKWKPPEYNTIDFLVEVEKNNKDKGNHTIQSKISSNSTTTISQYKTLLLKVGLGEGLKNHGYTNPQQRLLDMKINSGFKKKTKYRPEYFYPTEPYDPEAHICHIPLKPDSSGELKMFTEENEVIDDDTVVEFRYDLEEEDKLQRWKPLRVRYDKTMEYIKYRNNYGNAYHVANSNWHTIHNPITKEVITSQDFAKEQGEKEQDYDDGIYYDRSDGESKTKELRGFHNKVVKKMLFQFVNNKKNSSLIDFAIGKGGDIPKILRLNYGSIFGIDISEDNIHNRFDGACARYLSIVSGKKNRPHAIFIKGDSSKLIENGHFAFDDKSRNIYYALMGKGKRTQDMDKYTYKYYGVYKNKFDVGSIQFAIHYMFESKLTLHNFIRNVAKHVKHGGYFIGTCYNGKNVFNMLKGVEYNDKKELYVDTKKIWHIQKKYNESESETFENNETSIGMKVNVYQESINRAFDEYLVNFDYFIKVMKDYGFEPAPEIVVGKEKTKTGTNVKKIPSIGSFEYLDIHFNSEFEMTKEEKIISYLNNYFIFQNIGKMSDIAIQNVYDYYMGLDKKNTNDTIGKPEKLNIKVELN